MKSAAKNAGLTVEEYARRVAEGLKRCTKCKEWKPLAEFGRDSTRHDGTAAKCRLCCKLRNRSSGKPRVSPMKGKKMTEESRQKMRDAWAKREDKQPRLGKKHTLESRRKMSETGRKIARRGPAAPSYKDGKTAERRGIRFSAEYARWRYDVFMRDKFTCQECGDARGGNLRAHHKKPFADFPELRLDVDNGVTLCDDCHKKHHAAK